MKNQEVIKMQKEKIENRLLTVFATALGAEMLLLYLYNWFQPSSLLGGISAHDAAVTICHILMIVFVLLGIFTVVKGCILEGAGESQRSKKYMNWFYVCLAGLLSGLFIWPLGILTDVFKMDPMLLAPYNNFHPFFANNGVQFRVVLVMVLIGIYTVAAFVVYGVKSAKLGKKK